MRRRPCRFFDESRGAPESERKEAVVAVDVAAVDGMGVDSTRRRTTSWTAERESGWASPRSLGAAVWWTSRSDGGVCLRRPERGLGLAFARSGSEGAVSGSDALRDASGRGLRRLRRSVRRRSLWGVEEGRGLRGVVCASAAPSEHACFLFFLSFFFPFFSFPLLSLCWTERGPGYPPEWRRTERNCDVI